MLGSGRMAEIEMGPFAGLSEPQLLDLLKRSRRFNFGERVSIQWRDEGRWAICDEFGEVYNRNGEWEREPANSSRTDDFLKRARYSLKEALDRVDAAISAWSI